MIDRVQNSQFRKGNVDTEAVGGTVFYRGIFRNENAEDLFSEDILSLDETEFEEFICENYACDTYAGSCKRGNEEVDLKNGVLQMEAEQNSAFREYQSIIEELTGSRTVQIFHLKTVITACGS